MTDIPIIFSGPMVLALLAGRKTQTRRLLYAPRKCRKVNGVFVVPPSASMHKEHPAPTRFLGMDRYWDLTGWHKVKPGDRLWVRENFAIREGGVIHDAAGGQMDYVDTEIVYAAGMKHPPKLTPCIHMPRRYSRLTLLATTTKIERLQQISDADCLAEGPHIAERASWVDGGVMVYPDLANPHLTATPRAWYRGLWQTLHGRESWDENPAVVALTFTVHKSNIDTLARAA